MPGTTDTIRERLQNEGRAEKRKVRKSEKEGKNGDDSKKWR